MRTDSFWIGIGFGVLVGVVSGMSVATELTLNEVMQAAYDRGHAVQCLGREGYYWECEK